MDAELGEYVAGLVLALQVGGLVLASCCVVGHIVIIGLLTSDITVSAELKSFRNQNRFPLVFSTLSDSGYDVNTYFMIVFFG